MRSPLRVQARPMMRSPLRLWMVQARPMMRSPFRLWMVQARPMMRSPFRLWLVRGIQFPSPAARCSHLCRSLPASKISVSSAPRNRMQRVVVESAAVEEAAMALRKALSQMLTCPWMLLRRRATPEAVAGRGRGGGGGRGRGAKNGGNAPEAVPDSDFNELPKKVSDARGKSRGKRGAKETEPNESKKAASKGKQPKKETGKGSEKTEPDEPKKAAAKAKQPKKETGKGSGKTESERPKKAAAKAKPKLTEKGSKPGVEQGGVEKPAPKRKKPDDVKKLTEEEKRKKQLKSRKSCAYHWARCDALNLGFSEEEAKKKGQEVFWT